MFAMSKPTYTVILSDTEKSAIETTLRVLRGWELAFENREMCSDTTGEIIATAELVRVKGILSGILDAGDSWTAVD